jgi:hypothetical protein
MMDSYDRAVLWCIVTAGLFITAAAIFISVYDGTH